MDGKKWIFKFDRRDFAQLSNGKNKLTLKGAFGSAYDYGDFRLKGDYWIEVNKK